MDDQKKKCAVILMRHGERASGDSGAGLRKDDRGSNRGEQFIIDAIKTATSDRPYDRLYYAPTRISRETCEAFVRHDTVVVTSRMVLEESVDLHTQDPGWEAILTYLQNQKQTFGVLEEAEKMAAKNGRIPEGFLRVEGARIFGTIQNIVNELEEDSVVLCVMHSPLIEAVVLHVWATTMYPAVQAQKPLGELKFLEFLDYFVLLFHGDGCRFTLRKSYADRINKEREMNTLTLDLASKGPRIAPR